MEALRS